MILINFVNRVISRKQNAMTHINSAVSQWQYTTPTTQNQRRWGDRNCVSTVAENSRGRVSLEITLELVPLHPTCRKQLECKYNNRRASQLWV